MPDVYTAGHGVGLWLELKYKRLVNNNAKPLSDTRYWTRQQKEWLERMSNAGGRTYLLFGSTDVHMLLHPTIFSQIRTTDWWDMRFKAAARAASLEELVDWMSKNAQRL